MGQDYLVSFSTFGNDPFKYDDAVDDDTYSLSAAMWKQIL